MHSGCIQWINSTVYAEAIGVPFNLDSATANTIRFQVSDQAGNVYTEINAKS